jgi:hypothetical protein
MAVARPRIVAGAVLTAGLAAAGLGLVTQNGGGPKQVPGTYAKAERGVVDTTVGGVGHVTTLTGSALLSVPSFSSSSGAGVGNGSPVGSSVSAGAAAGASTTANASSGPTAVPADAVDGHPLPLEPSPDQTGHLRFVLDDQHAHGESEPGCRAKMKAG